MEKNLTKKINKVNQSRDNWKKFQVSNQQNSLLITYVAAFVDDTATCTQILKYYATDQDNHLIV